MSEFWVEIFNRDLENLRVQSFIQIKSFFALTEEAVFFIKKIEKLVSEYSE